MLTQQSAHQQTNQNALPHRQCKPTNHTEVTISLQAKLRLLKIPKQLSPGPPSIPTNQPTSPLPTNQTRAALPLRPHLSPSAPQSRLPQSQLKVPSNNAHKKKHSSKTSPNKRNNESTRPNPTHRRTP